MQQPSVACFLLDGGEQAVPDSHSAMIGQHDQVVDIDQRPRGECGETAEAGCQSDGLSVLVGEKYQRRGMIFEAGDEAVERFWWQRAVVAHGVEGVGRGERENIALMVGSIEIGFDYFDRRNVFN